MFCLLQGEGILPLLELGSILTPSALRSPPCCISGQPYCHPCGLTLPDVILPQGKGLGLSLENWIHLLKTLTQARKCLGVQAQLELIKAASVPRSGCGRDSLGGPCPALVAAVLRRFYLWFGAGTLTIQSCLVLGILLIL